MYKPVYNHVAIRTLFGNSIRSALAGDEGSPDLALAVRASLAAVETLPNFVSTA
jgi:hypothetical protein